MTRICAADQSEKNWEVNVFGKASWTPWVEKMKFRIPEGKELNRKGMMEISKGSPEKCSKAVISICM